MRARPRAATSLCLTIPPADDSLFPWCVVTTTEVPPAKPAAIRCHAVMIQRVQVPSRQAPERRVAGPQQRGRPRRLKPGVESERVSAS